MRRRAVNVLCAAPTAPAPTARASMQTGEGTPPRGKEPRLGPMSASFAGLMSTRVCRANASGHGVETMQLETQLTRRSSDMPAKIQTRDRRHASCWRSELRGVKRGPSILTTT